MSTAAETPEPEPVGEPAYSAPRIAAGTAVLGGLFAMAMLASGSFLAFVPAGLAVGLLLLGVSSGRRRVVTLGVALLFGSLILAGVDRVAPPTLLLAGVGLVLAHDGGQYAVTLGHQLGGDADTTRAELVHVGATATVASATAGLGALAFRVGTDGQPSTALVTLLFAAVLLVWALLR
jgi:hypothetical protein